MSAPTPPHTISPSTASRESSGSPETAAALRSALTNPALLRAMVRSLPTTAPVTGHSPPTAPDAEQTNRPRRRQKSQRRKSPSMTTPWNETLSPMSSQLPSPQPGRPAAEARANDDSELQSRLTPRGLLGAVRRWYHRHPAMVDILIALGVTALNLLGVFTLLTESKLASTYGSVLPLTILVLGLSGVALALRRRFPVWIWAALLILPEIHQAVIDAILPITQDESIYIALSVGFMTWLGVPITLGTIASHCRPTIAWTTWAVTMGVCSATIILKDPSFTLESFIREMTLAALVMTIGTLVGLNTRNARLRIEALETRSARVALAREQGALLAAAEERSRIAREMHDVIAHSLAVMITMADGASATVERNPATAKQAMETLAEAGRSALADTRRLVGVLREDPSVATGPTADSAEPAACPTAESGATTGSDRPASPSRPRWRRGGRTSSPDLSAPSATSASSARDHEVRDVPVPEFAPPGTVVPVEPSAPITSLRLQATDGGADRSRGELPLAPAPEQADIADLVRRFETAGVPVSYRWVGASLPEDKTLQLTLFRIAQEALTNVLRYAPTTPAVSVDVRRHIGTVILTVDNEAAPGTRPMHGSGKGLIGMRERASVYGGTVQAGPTPTGWRVRAVLRWDEHDEGTSSWQMPL